MNLKENEFSPAVGGSAGTSNYQVGYGTHTSPNNMQNPDHFAVGNNSNTIKNVKNPSEIQKFLDIIYSRPNPPSPDDIVSAIKRVMGRQIKKTPMEAKYEVLKNMAHNPNAYKGLQDMNIDDNSMMDNIMESRHPNDLDCYVKEKINVNADNLKEIFKKLQTQHEHKYVVNSGISHVMKLMWEQKRKRRM